MRSVYHLSDKKGRVTRVYVYVEDGIGKVLLSGDLMDITDKLDEKQRKRISKRFRCEFLVSKVN